MKTLGLVIGLTFAPLVLAQSPATLPADADAVGNEAVQTETAPERAANDVREHVCLRETGSNITRVRNQRAARHVRASGQAQETDCAPVTGRVWTRDDLERTGAIDLADALRRLDPSVR
ncbi:hypothetical protein [Luteimonas sp. e5]